MYDLFSRVSNLTLLEELCLEQYKASVCVLLQPHGLSMEFPRQAYWSGLPFPSPGDHPDPGTESWSPTLRADSLLSVLLGKPKQTLLLL